MARGIPSDPNTPGVVIPMRPPAPSVPLLPAADVLNDTDPSEEDDIDWSRYDG
jgi:hypothetical protein